MERILRWCDVIMIGARNGVKTGMEVWSDFPDAIDDNVSWKEHIQAVGEILNILDFSIVIEVGVIVSCMNTRVGTTASGDADRLAQFQAEAAFQFSLYARRLGLDLPSTVVGTVICQMDKISFHVTKIQNRLSLPTKSSR